MMHTFKRNEIITVINITTSGTFVIEGEAKILNPISGTDEHYTVQFQHDDPERTLCEPSVDRFVDPAAQSDPAAYVADLNEKVK